MALLDLALQQEQDAIQGKENESRYGAEQLIQDRTRRENERNAPLQVMAELAPVGGTKLQSFSQYRQQQGDQVKADMEQAAQDDPRDAKALEQSQANDTSSDGSSGLFGWLGKGLIGGFFGGSGGAGAAGSDAAAAGAASGAVGGE